MRYSIDLHSHSTASDGTLSPTALLHYAHEHNIQELALTDHDETAGLVEATAAAAEVGIKIIPGVEISVTWEKQTIHVVGLHIDAENQLLLQGLQQHQQFRSWRAEEIGRRLDKAGISGTYQRAAELAHGRIISRTHFAMALVESGHAKSVATVFKHYLRSNKPGHVAGEWADLQSAIAWIHAAGGIAVIAHPARYKYTRTKLCRLIENFVDLGGEAIEVISGSHSDSDIISIASIIKKYAILASSGSDFHDPNRTWNRFGRLPELPYHCRPVWELWH